MEFRSADLLLSLWILLCLSLLRPLAQVPSHPPATFPWRPHTCSSATGSPFAWLPPPHQIRLSAPWHAACPQEWGGVGAARHGERERAGGRSSSGRPVCPLRAQAGAARRPPGARPPPASDRDRVPRRCLRPGKPQLRHVTPWASRAPWCQEWPHQAWLLSGGHGPRRGGVPPGRTVSGAQAPSKPAVPFWVPSCPTSGAGPPRLPGTIEVRAPSGSQAGL